VVRNGSSAYQEIIGAATDGNVDLIIIGTHGRSGLAHVFLGSTAERVTRHAPCPVLVVREQEHDFVPGAEARSRSATERGHTSHSE
jgi:nucleotide-binding universal stress UspA family protein